MTAPYRNAEEITPNDTEDLEKPARAIYVGGAGNLTVQLARDEDPVTFHNVLAGSVLQIVVVKVLTTGTTATNLISLR